MTAGIMSEIGFGHGLRLEPAPVEVHTEIAFAVFPEMLVVFVCPVATVQGGKIRYFGMNRHAGQQGRQPGETLE